MAEPRVINDTNEFVPMPTPDQVVAEDANRRLDAVPFEFADIRALAQRILNRAVEQSQKKLAAARAQVEAMEKQAYDKSYKESFAKAQQDGFAKGEKEGLAAAEAKIAAAVRDELESLRKNAQPAIGLLENITAVLNDNRQRLAAQAEGDLLLLSLDIAKRLVGRELSLDPEAIRPLAFECIGLVAERSGVTLRVNPEDRRVMEELIPKMGDAFPDLGAVRIEPDPAIERGGLMALTREAEVDMRLATRLAAFEDATLGFSGEAAVPPWNAARAAAEPEAGKDADASPAPASESAVPPGSREPGAPPPPEAAAP